MAAMSIERSKLALFSFAIGVASLAAALLLILFQRSVTPLAQAAIVVAILALGVGIVLDRSRIRRFLGGRQARFGSNALILGVAVLGTLVLETL